MEELEQRDLIHREYVSILSQLTLAVNSRVVYAKILHGIAVEHGWWDNGDKNILEILDLIHSEISEASMSVLNEEPKCYISNELKPEGEHIELIDACIRAYDYLGYVGYKFSEVLLPEKDDSGREFSKLERHALLHMIVSDATEIYRDTGDRMSICPILHRLIIEIESYLCEHRYDSLADSFCLETGIIRSLYVIELYAKKAAYNSSRPIRHGGKFA